MIQASLRKALVTLAALSTLATVHGTQERPAAAEDTAPTHQIVRINNATSAPVKISYYSPKGQKWEDLAPNTYSDMDVAKGPAGNFKVKIVSEGAPNASNTHLATPPANPTHQTVLVENATAAKATVSFYSPGGQKWEALESGAMKSVDVARGPAGNILIQVVGNQGEAASANIAGEWTYGSGGGKATIQQTGSSVTYQGTWLSSHDRYELHGQITGNVLVGNWTLLGTSEKGTAKLEIAPDAKSMKVVEATGGRGWLGQVFLHQPTGL